MERAIAINPTSGLLYSKLGEIKARNKDKIGACEEWNKAKSLGFDKATEFIMYNCKN
jgi:hypothetical protein